MAAMAVVMVVDMMVVMKSKLFAVVQTFLMLFFHNPDRY